MVKRPYPAPGMSDGRTERGRQLRRGGGGGGQGAETQGADGDDAVIGRVARARTGHENRVLRGGTRREVEVRRRLIASEPRADAHTPARTRVRACEAPGCPRQHSYSFAVSLQPALRYPPTGALSQPRSARDAASVFSAGERRDRRNLRSHEDNLCVLCMRVPSSVPTLPTRPCSSGLTVARSLLSNEVRQMANA